MEPTEQEVVGHLENELLDAWLKLRSFAIDLGPQKVHASAKAVMFSRSVCYLFVRTRKASLEICFFLPEKIAAPDFKSIQKVSKVKYAYTILVVHEDQIARPLTDWIEMAWEHSAR
ncbi:MAG: hypothetical protein H7039_15170 [Bryobacteraceae bacterium]|nr:hypothetical protein [Bryobacteraceae bacterium]